MQIITAYYIDTTKLMYVQQRELEVETVANKGQHIRAPTADSSSQPSLRRRGSSVEMPCQAMESVCSPAYMALARKW